MLSPFLFYLENTEQAPRALTIFGLLFRMFKLIVFPIFNILRDLPKLYCFIYGQGGPGCFRDPSLKLFSGIVSPAGWVKLTF